MKKLFSSEWERMWSKKITWICFICIPFILLGTIKYYLGKNAHFTLSSPEYTTFLNFPSVAMQEQLITAINMLLLLLIALSITEEYRSGQLRMVMIRRYKFSEIIIAKYLVVLSVVFLFLVGYFIFSIILGYIILPKSDTTMFFFVKHPFTFKESLIYNFKYYTISFITLAAIGAFYMFIAIISKTTTIAIAINVGFLMFSGIYGYMIQIFSKLLTNIIGLEAVCKSMFLSLIQIQYQGICVLLSGKSYLRSWILGVLAVYIVLFSVLSYFLARRQDNLI